MPGFRQGASEIGLQRRVFWPRFRLAGATIAGATIAGATIAGATIAGATIAGATIAGATIAGATIAGATIAGATIECTRMYKILKCVETIGAKCG